MVSRYGEALAYHCGLSDLADGKYRVVNAVRGLHWVNDLEGGKDGGGGGEVGSIICA